MGVPADIRAVPRPTNTIVVDSGRETVNRYAVLKRAYVKYIPNGNPQPRNGKVVGHIINYKYVPIPEINIYSGPTKLQYGFGIYCLILFLNICMPGIGTLVAAFGWGRTVIPDKTGKLICHGIFQLATCIIIYGWIWAVVDALNSFEDGHWAC